MKLPTFRAFGVYDRWGACGMTAREEAEYDAEHLALMLRLRVKIVGMAERVAEVAEGVDLVLFDYGGVAGAYGSDLFGDQSRAAMRWAEDHPSGLLIVASAFTWERGFRPKEMRRFLPRTGNVLPMRGPLTGPDRVASYKRIAEWLGVEVRS